MEEKQDSQQPEIESNNEEQAPSVSTTDATNLDENSGLDATQEPPLLPHLQQHQKQLSQITNNEVNYEEEAQKLEDKALRFLSKQTHPVIIPSFVTWFDFAEIHQIEKNSLPDFFDDSSRFKTPKAYKDTRNFMINTYRLSPYEYLTMTAVRRNVAMDVASIIKIHAFLEKWGLINYQIDPRSKPSVIGPSFTGHFQVTLDTPQGLKPFIPSKMVQPEDEEFQQDENSVENKKDITFVAPTKFPVNLSLRKNIYETINDFNALQSKDKISKQINKTYVCHTCGNDAILIRYHNLRARDANICSRCFQEGHFGANFQSSDFIKLENNPNFYKKQWSDQEILLLLEGIEMYEDQWERIVDHIGSNKTIEDCVHKFLTLPIEDQFINDVIGEEKTKENNNNVNSNKNQYNNVTDAIDVTIKSLLDGVNKEILEEKIPESSKQISKKYLEETQVVVQELVNLTLQKLNLKFEKLDKMEEILNKEKAKYVKESEKLLNDRISLSTQVNELNKELAQLNISKKLVLASEQVDQSIELVEKDADNNTKSNSVTPETELLQKKAESEVNAVSLTEPQTYKPWSL